MASSEKGFENKQNKRVTGKAETLMYYNLCYVSKHEETEIEDAMKQFTLAGFIKRKFSNNKEK